MRPKGETFLMDQYTREWTQARVACEESLALLRDTLEESRRMVRASRSRTVEWRCRCGELLKRYPGARKGTTVYSTVGQCCAQSYGLPQSACMPKEKSRESA